MSLCMLVLLASCTLSFVSQTAQAVPECDWISNVCASDNLSVLCSLLEYAEFPSDPYLGDGITGSFTLLAPNNDAITKYVDEAGVALDGSIESIEHVTTLLQYHMLRGRRTKTNSSSSGW